MQICKMFHKNAVSLDSSTALFPVPAASGDNDLFDNSNEETLVLENSGNWTRRCFQLTA